MPLCFADWSQTESSGDWLLGTRLEWKALEGQDEGTLTYQYPYCPNFTGYHATINMSTFEGLRKEWWWMVSEKSFFWSMAFHNVDTGQLVYVYIRMREVTNTWGFIWDKNIIVDVRENETQNFFWDGNYYARDEFFDYDWFSGKNYAEIFVWKDGANLRIVIVHHRGDQPKAVRLWNSTINLGESFFENVTLTNRLKHAGYGYFNGGCIDQIYENTPYSPSLPDMQEIPVRNILDQFIHDISQILTNNLPQWAQDFIGQLQSWWAGLQGILAMVWGIVTQIVPFFPFILLCWILDAVITSVTEGNIHPLGIVFTTIFEVGRGIIQTLVTIAHTVYDILIFWS
jgi:hypothetical protein